MPGLSTERVRRFVEQLRGLRVHTPYVEKVYDLETGTVGGASVAREHWGWIIHLHSLESAPPRLLQEAKVTLVGDGQEVVVQPLRILGENMLLVIAPKDSAQPPLRHVEGVRIRVGAWQRWFGNK